MTEETKHPMFVVWCVKVICVRVCVCYSSDFCSPSAEKDTVSRSREGEQGGEDVEQLSLRGRIEEEVLEMQ